MVLKCPNKYARYENFALIPIFFSLCHGGFCTVPGNGEDSSFYDFPSDIPDDVLSQGKIVSYLKKHNCIL